MRPAALTTTALLLLLAVPIAAQNTVTTGPKSPRPAADSALAAPAPIPLADIPNRAQTVEFRLDEIRQVIPRDRAVAQVAKAYAAAQDTIQELMTLQSRPGQARTTKRSLTDIHNEWLRRIDQVKGWQSTVSNRTNALSNIQAELATRRSTWRLTQAAAVRDGAPSDILELTAGVIRNTAGVEDTVSQRLRTVLQLQSQLSRTLTTLQQSAEQVNEQLASIRRDLLRFDAPPLWKGLGTRPGAPGVVTTAREGLSRTRDEVNYFLEVYRLPVYFHLASTVGILFAIVWFRRKLEPHTAEQPAASARRVLDRPVAGALLISALGVLFLYTRAPLAAYDLALLVTIPAVLRLLPSFLPANLLRPAIAGSLLFAVQRIGGMLLSGSMYQRPGNLAIGLLAGGALLWLLRRGGELERLGATGYARALQASARLAATVFLIGVIANILGNASLALVLINGMLASSYLLLVVVAAVRIINGLLVVAIRSEAVSASRYVAQRKDALVRTGVGFVHLAAAIGWLAITLLVFDLLAPAEALVRRVLSASLVVGELHLSLGAALTFVTTLWVSYLVSRTASDVLESDVLSRVDMPRGLPNVIGRLTRYTLIGLGFIFALAAIGLQLTQLTLIGGALGVGVGFGLQNIVANFVSGLTLAFERPIREGDLIEVQQLQGEVKHIGFRASVIRSFEGAEVIVPNSALTANNVTNWTLSDPHRRLAIDVGVAYGSDPDRVLELLRLLPSQHASILKEPAPQALFTGFGDSALNFEVRFWITDAAHTPSIRSEVTTAINNALTAAGIEIPFPQRDLHLRSVDGPAAAQLRGAPSSKETT